LAAQQKFATATLPWSLRARPGAPVATPISWDELAQLKSAAAFNIRTALDRKDSRREFFKSKQALPTAAVDL